MQPNQLIPRLYTLRYSYGGLCSTANPFWSIDSESPIWDTMWHDLCPRG